MITAKDVKKLRDMTGAGMMDCKKALTEANGDFEAAVDILRKKGQKVSVKRADRDAKEGLIITQISKDKTVGVIVEVNCETDFVARNKDFAEFANTVTALTLANKPANLDALKSIPYANGQNIGEMTTELMGKIGEKIDVRRFNIVKTGAGEVIDYIHPGSRLGVLVELKGDGTLADLGRDVAMQIAAMNPVATRIEEVAEHIREKELEIGRETARNQNKPEHIIENIAAGKLKRYYKDNVLVEQAFVKDSSQTVGHLLKKAGTDVVGYTRFALGG